MPNDFQYAVFGRVTKGDDTLRKLERLPTHKEGIFVMVCSGNASPMCGQSVPPYLPLQCTC